jgi:hypothetical protein
MRARSLRDTVTVASTRRPQTLAGGEHARALFRPLLRELRQWLHGTRDKPIVFPTCSVLFQSAYNESEGMSPVTAPSVATDDQRWSEVVPPDAALTFAAVYDPDGQWMTFSGAELLSSTRHVSANMPSDDFDNDSQILAFDSSAIPASNDNTATMAFFRENFDTKTPIFERYKQTKARASSTCDGVDVYAGETSRAGGSRNSRPPRQWSIFNRLDEGPGFDPRTAFDGIPVPRSGRKEIPRARAERVKQKRSLGAQNGHRSDLTDDGAVLVNLNLVSLCSVHCLIVI